MLHPLVKQVSTKIGSTQFTRDSTGKRRKENKVHRGIWRMIGSNLEMRLWVDACSCCLPPSSSQVLATVDDIIIYFTSEFGLLKQDTTSVSSTLLVEECAGLFWFVICYWVLIFLDFLKCWFRVCWSRRPLYCIERGWTLEVFRYQIGFPCCFHWNSSLCPQENNKLKCGWISHRTHRKIAGNYQDYVSNYAGDYQKYLAGGSDYQKFLEFGLTWTMGSKVGQNTGGIWRLQGRKLFDLYAWVRSQSLWSNWWKKDDITVIDGVFWWEFSAWHFKHWSVHGFSKLVEYHLGPSRFLFLDKMLTT